MISGANTAALTIYKPGTGWSTSNSRTFHVNVTYSRNTITSSEASLIINSPATITAQPVDDTIWIGKTTTFASSSSGKPTPSKQWQRYLKTGWTDIKGATSSTYTTGSAGTYRIEVSNTCATEYSAPAILMVMGITSHPSNVTICSGYDFDVSFTVGASGAGAYQWYYWVPDKFYKFGGYWQSVKDATSSTYTVSPPVGGFTTKYNNQYRCEVTFPIGVQYSNSAYLTVHTKPSITQHPVSQSKNEGESVTFNVSASSTLTKFYQWYKDDDPVGGATGSSLTLSNLQAGDAGIIYYTTDGGEIWTVSTDTDIPVSKLNSVYMVNEDTAYAITESEFIKSTNGGINWDVVTSRGGNGMDFISNSEGWICALSGKIYYTNNGGQVWYEQKTPATQLLYAISMVDSDNGWAVGDDGAMLRTALGGCWLPRVSLYEDKELCASLEYLLRADTFDVAYPTYFWSTGSDNGSINVNTTGKYYVDVWNICGDKASDTINVKFFDLPEADAGRDTSLCYGDTIQLGATGGVMYSWNHAEYLSDPGIPNPLAGAPLGNTDFIVTVTDTNGCVNKDTVLLKVYQVPTSTFTIPESVCEGLEGMVSYTGNATAGANYAWDFDSGDIISGENEGPYQISWATEGTKTVSLQVTRYGCVSDLTQKDIVVAYPYEGEEICLVSVDKETGKNMVIWEKTPDAGIAAYNVYRETNVKDVYELLSTIPYDSLSVFVDMTSKPKNKAHLYKISVVDTCGNESQKSLYHKTLFLQYGGSVEGVIMNWGEYEIEGEGNEIDFESYIIYRGSDSTKLQPIDTVSASLDQYTDTDPDALAGRRYYRIAGVKSEACDPANLLGKKAGTGPYSHSLSNLEDNRLQGSGVNDLLDSEYQLRVYPNPFSQKTRIAYDLKEMSEVKIEVFNLLGARVSTIVNQSQAPGDYTYDLTAADIGSTEGIYYMRFTANGQSVIRKLILSR